ncbi:MAG: CocE/NonD family hydrolase, partial [Caulobacteraceae bacterium]
AYDAWPRSCAAGCPETPRASRLRPGGGLGFERPSEAAEDFVAYVSDPAKPVPYRSRPIRPTYADDSTWSRWLVDDQREFSSRPDVVSWTSEPLAAPVRIAGAPQVHLRASTSGADADWVVKLIDVYPGEVPARPALGGYQLMVAADIFRGRYRDGYSNPKPIPPGQVETFAFPLPNASHVFLPGHRIMVQAQSSWFPLYDRNPQTWVDNIFFAKKADYRAATQRIADAGPDSSYIDLPVVAGP